MLKKILKWLLIGMVLVVLVMGLYIYLSLPDVRELQTKTPASTALIEYRARQAQQSNKYIDIRQNWVDFDAIPNFQQGYLLFWYVNLHNGVGGI